MVIALIILAVLALLGLRALYTLYTVSSFKNGWDKQNNKPISENSLIVGAIGDSTVQGVGALVRNGGFVPQTVSRVEKKIGQKIQVYNYSVSGSDSGEIQSQIDKIRSLPKIDAVIIAVGPNDITHGRSLEQFIESYEKMLDSLTKDKVVAANLPPMKPVDTNGDNSAHWNRSLETLLRSQSVSLANVYSKVLPRNNDPLIYGGDFYHPSSTGYKLWADAFEEPLTKILSRQVEKQQ